MSYSSSRHNPKWIKRTKTSLNMKNLISEAGPFFGDIGAEEAFDKIKNSLEYESFSQNELDLMLYDVAKQTPIIFNVTPTFNEDLKVKQLEKVRDLIMDRGADPLTHLKYLLQESHFIWAHSLLLKICEDDRKGIKRSNSEGHTALHICASIGWDMTPSGKTPHEWPKEWMARVDNNDGMTPLHLVWRSYEGIAAKALRIALNPTVEHPKWHASEYLEQAICTSRYLVYNLGASWDFEDKQGRTAGDYMAEIWESKLSDELPNTDVVSWFPDEAEHQVRLRNSKIRRLALEDLLSVKPASNRQIVKF